jgi:hypothetical protein
VGIDAVVFSFFVTLSAKREAVFEHKPEARIEGIGENVVGMKEATSFATIEAAVVVYRCIFDCSTVFDFR